MASIRNKVKTLGNLNSRGKRRGIIIKRRQDFLSELASAYSDVLNDEHKSGKRKGFFKKHQDTDETYYSEPITTDDTGEDDLDKTIVLSVEESEAINQLSLRDRIQPALDKLEPAREWLGDTWGKAKDIFGSVKEAVGGVLSKIPGWDKYWDRRRQRKPDYNATESIFVKRWRRPNYIFSVAATTLKMFFIALLVLAFVGAGALVGVADAYRETSPELDVGVLDEKIQTTYIYDKNGVELMEYRDYVNRDWMDIEDIPENMKNAIVAVEDVRFYEHEGVDVKRVVGSFMQNMTSDSVQGGSTITQQIIKNNMLSPERSYKRKIQEAYLAVELEKKLSKDKILEAYINGVDYGENNYGVYSAAKDYFRKELDELTIRECAMLAGVINNATTYNPRKNYYDEKRLANGSKERTDNRTNHVLTKMFGAGFITSEEYEAALKEELNIYEKKEDLVKSEHIDFIEYAIQNVIDMYLKQRNMENTPENRKAAENDLKTGGYKIYTTLDPDVQTTVENIVYEYKKYPKMKYKSDTYAPVVNVDGDTIDLIQPQASVAVIDYRTGEVVAIVGGRQKSDGLGLSVNRALNSRQPVGSSIKPIAVYAPAIDNAALGEGTIIQNIEGPVRGWNVGTSGRKYPLANGSPKHGVTMREAIVKSMNLCAARTLMELSGDNNEKNIQTSIDYLTQLGIPEGDHLLATGSGLALGTNGMTMAEEAGAYGALANGGVFMEPIAFTKVTTREGTTVIDAKDVHAEREVFQESTAWMMIDMMTEAVNSGTGKEARISGMQVAGKTGTNDNHIGVTFAGVTPYYSCAVYIGSDKYKELESGTFGGGAAAPLWKEIMVALHEGLAYEGKPIKSMEKTAEEVGLEEVTMCRVSGLKAGNSCGQWKVSGLFKIGTVSEKTCDWHKGSTSVCAETGLVPTQYCPRRPTSAISIPSDAEQILRSAVGLDNLRRTYGSGSSGGGKVCDLHTQAWYDAMHPPVVQPEAPPIESSGELTHLDVPPSPGE